MSKKKKKIYRSSVTGEFVPKDYAEENPATTQKETVELPDKTETETAEEVVIVEGAE